MNNLEKYTITDILMDIYDKISLNIYPLPSYEFIGYRSIMFEFVKIFGMINKQDGNYFIY